MIEIATFINFPVNSNCYVVYSKQSKQCLIIDPGSEDPTSIVSFIEKIGLIPDYIILTHEHFDHIWGVKHLKEIYHANVLCSKECADSITNPKKNMSAFFKPPGFSLSEADVILSNNTSSLIWGKYIIDFYPTPGHTEGSICFTINNYLFTGDTLIKDEETVTKLPGGSKLKLKESLNLLNSLINSKTIIMSGHGDSFDRLKYKD